MKQRVISKLIFMAAFCYCTHFGFTQSKDSCITKPSEVLIDAGGHKLHMDIQGAGSPVVIFENGSGDFSFIWSLVQPEIAKLTKTVSYDRAGYACSEQGPLPRTGRQICWELHMALKNAGVNPPYVLVGQSFGGFIVRAFARYYPGEVVGMVLVEAVQEDQRIFMQGDTPMRIRDFAKNRIAPEVQTSYLSSPDTSTTSLTMINEIDPLFKRFPENIQRMQIWAQSQPQYIPALQAEMDWSPEDVSNLYQHRNEKAYLLGNMPLIVMTRSKGGFEGRKDSLQLEKERLAAQEQLVHLSSNSKHVIDMNSGHNIHVEDPGAVIEAIEEVLIAVKSGAPLKQ
jgi:pimeloyl-ACP methyl ester carboxylesterase